jgi:hypothetical protein
MSIKINKDKETRWKIKAKARQKDLNRLTKRMREIEESRNSWKIKYKAIKKGVEVKRAEERAKGHHFSLLLILISLNIQTYGSIGLRACRHSLICLNMSLHLWHKVPSYGSIRNWVLKSGYHKLHQYEQDKEQGNTSIEACKWVIWVDESVVMGSQRLLLVLGMPVNEWDFTQSVGAKDVHVLSINAQASWTGEDVSIILKRLKTHLQIVYVVSDNGIVLKNAYKQSGIVHVSDCSHELANGLEKAYKNDKHFIEFLLWIGQIRAKWAMSPTKVIYTPPAHRTKARFANVFPLIEWGIKTQEWLEQSADIDILNNTLTLKELKDIAEVKITLKELDKYNFLIKELYMLKQMTSKICQLLKIKGASSQTIQESLNILKQAQTNKQKVFARHIEQYLTNLNLLLEMGGDNQTLICCSDIIESHFGKIKLKISPYSPYGLTQFIWATANFNGQMDKNNIKQALEEIKLKDIEAKKAKNNKSIVQRHY